MVKIKKNLHDFPNTVSHEVGAKWIFEIQAAFCGFSRKMVPRKKH